MNQEQAMALIERGPTCWSWLGGHGGADRRPIVHLNGKKTLVYRLTWEVANGRSIPSGLYACHRCDNPSCVNPEHIFIGTALDNGRDAAAKGRLRGRNVVRGAAHKLAKNTDAEVHAARESFASGAENQREIAERLGVSQSVVGHWMRGTTRKEAGGPITHRGRGHRFRTE